VGTLWEVKSFCYEIVIVRVFDVSKHEDYLANAAECERMAMAAHNDTEKRTWQQMADSWKLKAKDPAPKSANRPSGSMEPEN
jgi:hypothetical protein